MDEVTLSASNRRSVKMNLDRASKSLLRVFRLSLSISIAHHEIRRCRINRHECTGIAKKAEFVCRSHFDASQEGRVWMLIAFRCIARGQSLDVDRITMHHKKAEVGC